MAEINLTGKLAVHFFVGSFQQAYCVKCFIGKEGCELLKVCKINFAISERARGACVWVLRMAARFALFPPHSSNCA